MSSPPLAASPRSRRLPRGVGARTHPGLVRRNNEDAWLALPPLYAVADGMGGRAAGEIAAHTAIDALERRARAARSLDAEALREILAVANAEIRSAAETDPSLRGMGTTCTALSLEGRRALVANVGDSRAYRLRGEVLEQLTTDHTLVDELVAAGRMTAAEAAAHVDRSVITRALGAGPEVQVDVIGLEVEPRDRLLLCSDGLTTMVEPDEIRAVLATAADPQRAADELVELALRGGGEDNVTVVVVDPDAAARPAAAGRRVRAGRRGVVLAALVLVLAVGAGALASGLVPGVGPVPGAASPDPAASESSMPTASPSPRPTPRVSPTPRPSPSRRTAPPVAAAKT